jgi:hypothetical protein
VSITGYAYPWDYLGDPAAPARGAELGVDVVALAASYHAARVVSPLNPTRRVSEIPKSSTYIPIRDEAWRGHRLRPSAPTWLNEDNSFNKAQQRLADVGLEVDAWIVLTHVDDIGAEHSNLVVRNAFGEPYAYALCPSAADVREYCLTLVEETLATTSCRGVILEACGPMGFGHASAHDKSDFAVLSAAQEQLLSICFCGACHVELRAIGVDPEELAERVRSGVDEGAVSVEDALGNECAEAVAQFRLGLSATLRRAVVERAHAVQPAAKVTAHVAAGRWATGSFSAAGPSHALSALTTAVANCWDPVQADAELRGLAERLPTATNLGAYVRVDRGWSGDAHTDEVMGRYVESGVSELHLYHLGLLTRASLRTARHVVSAFRDHLEHSGRDGSSSAGEA